MTRISSYCLTTLLVLASSFAQGAEINQNFKLLPNAGEGAGLDRMGQAVAVSGTTAVVGAYLSNNGAVSNAGAVHVFTRTGTAQAPTWTRQQKITPPSPTADDLFGNAVAVSGDTLAIAAVQDDETSIVNSGAIYVFTRIGSTWTLQQRIIASDPTANAGFGRSLAVDGDTVVVGANLANGGTGAAYVFTRSGSSWSQQQRLLAQGGAVSDYFGGSVAISGDRIVVGAERANGGNKIDVGAAYAFARSGAGVWTQQTKLSPSTFDDDDNFGSSVGISGSSIVVGQPYLGVGVGSNKGAAIVFVEQSSGWVFQAILTATDASANDYLGRSVSISGDLVVAGAYYDDTGTGTSPIVNGGSAYLFRRTGTAWAQSDKFLGSDVLRNDALGSAVAISAGVSIVGAPFGLTTLGAEAGSAYAYTREDGTTTSLAVNTSALTYGQSVTMTAGVGASPFAAAAPTGSMTFYNGSTVLQTVQINGNGQAQYTLNPSAGELNLTAHYGSDVIHLASSSAVRNVTVSKAATSLAMTPPGSSSVPYGTNLVYTATLSAVGAPVPTGNIRFIDGASTLVGTAPLTAGVATLNIPNLSVGSHNIKAEYLGDNNYVGFTTTANPITVVKASVTLTLTTDPDPALEGDAVRLVATLAGGIPTGLSVGFQMISPTSVIMGGSSTDSAGVANINIGVLSIGSYQFRATFFGDANHFPVTDDSGVHNVLAAANLSITKSNGEAFVQSGALTSYSIVVTNAGPNPVVGATVIDDIDDDLVTGLFLPDAPWTCAAAGGATCAGGTSGSGDINLSVNVPVGGSITIGVDAQTRADAEPFVSNTASVSLPETMGDPDGSNNSSNDSDPSGIFGDGLENAEQ